MIKTFQAGVDIALMPIEFRTAATAGRLSSLIDAVVAAVDSGKISKTELDQSVQRIVLLKLQHTVLNAPRLQYFLKPGDIGTPDNKALESEIVNKSITLLKNEASLLPLQLGRNNIHIITPLAEQTDALRMRFHQLGHASVTGAHIANTTFEDQQAAVDAAEIVIIGSNSTAPMPLVINGDPHTSFATQKFALDPRAAGETGRRSLVYNVEGDRFDRSQVNKLRSVGSDNQFMRYVIEYAKSNNKKIIHITLRAPHDVVNFDDLADVTLATYSYMGYAQFLRGPSLPAVVDVILGRTPALGKLPVNIWNLNPDGSLGSLKYARGFGLSSAAL